MCTQKVDIQEEVPNHIRDAIARIKEYPDELRRASYHFFTQIVKYIDVDGGIFENVL